MISSAGKTTLLRDIVKELADRWFPLALFLKDELPMSSSEC